jgi:hypothetical protein
MTERWLNPLWVKDDPADGVPRAAPYRVRFAPSTLVTTIRSSSPTSATVDGVRISPSVSPLPLLALASGARGAGVLL